MKKSTLAVVGAIAAIAVHGIALFFGHAGVALTAAVVFTFCSIAWIFYRRALKRLHASTHGMSYEQRSVFYRMLKLDAEAQRDIEEIGRRERRSSEVRQGAQREMPSLRPISGERLRNEPET